MPTYFVSYAHNGKFWSGFGNSEVTVESGINNFDDVKAVAEHLKGITVGADSIVILNWKEIDAREPAPGAERKGEPNV